MNKSNSNCLVCFEKPPDTVFMNCGHGGICYECALDLWRSSSECFLCRKVNLINDNKENCLNSINRFII